MLFNGLKWFHYIFQDLYKSWIVKQKFVPFMDMFLKPKAVTNFWPLYNLPQLLSKSYGIINYSSWKSSSICFNSPLRKINPFRFSLQSAIRVIIPGLVKLRSNNPLNDVVLSVFHSKAIQIIIGIGRHLLLNWIHPPPHNNETDN